MVAYTAIQKFPGCGRNDSWQNLARAAVILFLFFCFLFFCALITLHAQVDSGKIVGTVKDASGAIVSAATVTVTETQTNAKKKIDTNSAGEYVVTELKPGLYTVKAERAGFKTAVEAPFKLDINQVVRLDFSLVVGSVQEQVVVTAAEPLVESETSSIGQVIGESQVHQLPLNGRDFIQLAYLSPGVNMGPASSGSTGNVQQGDIPEDERGNGSIQVNGLWATNNNYLLNGFDNNEQQIGFELIEPPVDAIQEFKVQTNNFSADIGKGGAVVNVVTKAGTNRFHGSAFEFLRNSFMDAKNYFDDPSAPIPGFKRNEFGGSLGGPIIRDRTFFFADYQGRRIRTSETYLSPVPSSSEVGGNFSDLLTGPSPTVIIDPVTGNQFMGNNNASPNVIPSCPSPTGGACLDPAALKTVALFPQPNVAPALGDLFLYNPVNRNNQDAFDVRVDHQISSQNSFFGIFSYGNVQDHNPDPFPGIAGGGSFTGDIKNKSLLAGLSDIQAFSPTKINELKIGYSRYVVDAVPFFQGQPLATQLGIPGINQPNSPITGGLPNIQISGLNSLGNGDYFPETLNEDNYQLLDAFTYIRGHHSFKMGGDLRRREHGFYQVQNPHGDFYYTGQFTNDPLADFLIGYTQSLFRDEQTGAYGMSWWEFGTYLMDDYRASDKLTLNLGVRYDVYTPMVEQHNRLANFDFQTGYFVAPGVTPGTSRSGDVVTNWKNFSPRIGFAYSLGDNGKTAVRGGYGIFYDEQADQNDTELAYNDLPGVYGSQSLTAALGSSTPVMVLSQGPSPIVFSSITNPTGRASAAYFHNPTTYIEEWNLNIERQLMKDMVLQVGYEGTRGVHLTYLRNLNQATQPLDSNFSDASGNEGRPYESTVPNIAAIRTEGHDISLINHGLQVRFEKRSSNGWSMLNSYTFQHTIGQATESETPNSDGEPQDTYNMRAERGDVTPDFRHQFTSAWSYELPFGPGRRYLQDPGRLGLLTGGWQLNAIISLYSGQAFTPYLSFDPTNTGSGGPRPDLVGHPYDFSNAAVGFDGGNNGGPTAGCANSTHQNLNCWYNPAAFAFAPLAPGQTFATVFGNATRGSLRGPAFYNTDFSVFKDFKIKEKGQIQLRGEIFNLFNTPQFALPNNLVDTPTAGQITSTLHESRQIQVSANFSF
ncbi:MAG: carboxypeptidase regulatory-like domain-containing protein [Candidatus Sulfotelmatobacter sp.]